MKLEIKAFGIWSLIKVTFFLNLILGFMIGVLTALFLVPMMALMSEMGGFPGMPTQDIQLSFGAMLIVIPVMNSLLYAVFGTILISIMAGLYNLVARLLGGIEINVADLTMQPVVTTAPADAVHRPTMPPPPSPIHPPTAATPPIEPSRPSPTTDSFGRDKPENDQQYDR